MLSAVAGYCLGLWWTAQGDWGPLAGWEAAAAAASALLAAAGLACWYLWRRDRWAGHPLARVLTSYSETGLWLQTAADVNREFRRWVKVSPVTGPGRSRAGSRGCGGAVGSADG